MPLLRDHAVGLSRLVLVGAVALFLLSGGPTSRSAARAVDGSAGPVSISVNKTADGTGISARAEAPPGVLIYEIAARLCVTGSAVRSTFDFGFAGRKCTTAPVGGSDVDRSVAYEQGTGIAELPYFRLGTGTTRWINTRGYDQEITCGPGAPCDVVIQVQITDGTVFFPATVCFDAVCPAGTVGETPPPASAPAPAPAAPLAGADALPSAPTAASSGDSSPRRVPEAGTGSAAATGEAERRPDGSASASGGDPEKAPRASGILLTTEESGPSQATRVRAAALAGVAGGALIVGLVGRGRRQMEEAF